MKLAPDWFQSKTFWTMIAAILYAVSGASIGKFSWQTAIIAIFAALQTFNIRDAIVKG